MRILWIFLIDDNSSSQWLFISQWYGNDKSMGTYQLLVQNALGCLLILLMIWLGFAQLISVLKSCDEYGLSSQHSPSLIYCTTCGYWLISWPNGCNTVTCSNRYLIINCYLICLSFLFFRHESYSRIDDLQNWWLFNFVNKLAFFKSWHFFLFAPVINLITKVH